MSEALSIKRRADRVGLAAYGAIAALGAVLAVISARYPADMPVIGPYEFQWAIYLPVALSVFWYLRGMARLAPARRPPLWRRVAFAAGVLVIWVAVQTGFEYLAQRMFFLNRIQHVAMHHIGPVLIGLSMAGPVIVEGAPGWVGRLTRSRAVGRAMGVIQQPAVATFFFVGLFYFWLIPPVHFIAMLDPRLYQVMNWTMVVDGILFWAMVLDTRPRPPATARFGVRAALSVAVMFPQIVLGALITFATSDIFPYYAYCGRYFPGIDAVTDQQIGGIIIWIPPAMMSVIGLLVVLSNMRRAEEG